MDLNLLTQNSVVTYGVLFETTYGFTPYQVGMAFAPMILGSLLAVPTIGIIDRGKLMLLILFIKNQYIDLDDSDIPASPSRSYQIWRCCCTRKTSFLRNAGLPRSPDLAPLVSMEWKKRKPLDTALQFRCIIWLLIRVKYGKLWRLPTPPHQDLYDRF